MPQNNKTIVLLYMHRAPLTTHFVYVHLSQRL